MRTCNGARIRGLMIAASAGTDMSSYTGRRICVTDDVSRLAGPAVCIPDAAGAIEPIAQRDDFCANANIHVEFPLLIYDQIATG